VTYSPILCPEGKNHLFTLKPYETQPGLWGEYLRQSLLTV